MDKQNVLIIEPYKSIGILILNELEEKGIPAILCHSWEDAVGFLPSWGISLVLFDPKDFQR